MEGLQDLGWAKGSEFPVLLGVRGLGRRRVARLARISGDDCRTPRRSLSLGRLLVGKPFSTPLPPKYSTC